MECCERNDGTQEKRGGGLVALLSYSLNGGGNVEMVSSLSGQSKMLNNNK